MIPSSPSLATNPTRVSDEWFTPPQAAQRINVSVRSIYRAVRAGELKATQVNGRGDLRIADSWLMAWMEKRSERRQ
jgi:excisionase family DNA binding protein